MRIQFKRATSLLVMAAMICSNFSGLTIKASAEVKYAEDLIISEYVEGGSNNKAIEIYNGTGKEVNLDGYALELRPYSSNKPGTTKNVALTGTIGHNEVRVFKNSGMAVPGLSDTVKNNDAINFNGDDFIILMKKDQMKKDQIIDVFGSDKGENTAADQTYVRHPSVMKGNVVSFNPNGHPEWIKFAKDVTNNLMSHEVSYGSNKVLPVKASINSKASVNAGTTVTFESLTFDSSVQISVFDGTNYGPSEKKKDYVIEKNVKLKVTATAQGLEDSEAQEFEYFVNEVQQPIVDIKTVKAGYVDQKDPKTDKQDFIDDRGDFKIKATVTVLNYSNYTFAQDATAGIGLKLPSELVCQVGDELEITGTLQSDFDFMFMSPRKDQVKKVGTKLIEPEAITIDQVNAQNQGKFVKLVNTKIISGPDFTNEFKVESPVPTAVLVKPAKAEWVKAGVTYETISGVVFYSYKKYSLAPALEDHVVENALQVKSVKANIAPGKVTVPLELTTATPEAKIYYTINGGSPVDDTGKLIEGAIEYKAPIEIKEASDIKAIAMKPGSPSSHLFSATFYPVKEVGKKEIYEIQGASHKSPFEFSSVNDVEGIVTAVASNGFYMQSIADDKNDNTSNGIFVNFLDQNKMPTAKDHVLVSGTVSEYTNTSDKFALSTTEIVDSQVTVKNKNVTLPVIIVLGEGGRQIPTAIIDNDSFSVFDPEEDAIDFYESIEGMLVQVDEALVTGNYGSEFNIVSNKGRLAADRLTIYGGIKLTETSENPDNILVVNGLSGTSNAIPNMGNEFAAPIKGIMTYKKAKYVLMNNEVLPPLLTGDQVTKRTPLVRETTSLEAGTDKLTVASYNVENFSAATGKERVGAIADTMIINLKTPDIIGLLEIQDDNGPKVDDGNVSAIETLKLLTSTINTKTKDATDYDFVQIDPQNNLDGGEGGANIRVAFIYNKKRVSLRQGTSGDSVTPVAVANKHLTLNPGRIFSEDPLAFEKTRKSLAAEFEFNGETVVTIANHFSSKSGSGPLFGKQQPKIDPVFEKRVKQGQAINTFVKEYLKQDPNAKLIAMGDLNAFEFEASAKALAGTELTNLAYKLPLNERFSYIFEGSSQILDQMLVSPSLTKKVNFDIVHINAFFTAKQGSVSDHDPVVAQFDLSAGTWLSDIIKDFNQLVLAKTVVEVKGTIASKVRTDSKKASNFYLNDETGGMAIWVKAPVELNEGDTVLLKGICGIDKDLMQLVVDKAENIKVINKGSSIVYRATQLNEINVEKAYMASKIDKALLKEVTTDGDLKYGNTLWKFEKEGENFEVKLDSRFGEKFDAISATYQTGQLYTITGFIEWNTKTSKYCIRVDQSSDVFRSTEPTQPIQSTVTTVDSKNQVKATFDKNDVIYIKTDLKKMADSTGSAIMLYTVTKNSTVYRFGSTESELIRAGNQSHKYGFDTAGLESGEYTINVYIWDSLDKMKPIAEAVKTTITLK